MQSLTLHCLIATLCMVVLAGCDRASRPGADAGLVVVQLAYTSSITTSRTLPRSDVTVPVGPAATSLVISKYDASNAQVGRANFGEVVFSSDKQQDGFIGRAVEPGTYAVTRFVIAGHWGACFGAKTWQFTLMPRQVLYLGQLDAQIHTRELAAATVAAGKQSLSAFGVNVSDWVWYDNTTAPAFRPNHGAFDLAAVKAYTAGHFPAFMDEPGFATLSPATFDAGRSMVNLGQRSCGSMFN